MRKFIVIASIVGCAVMAQANTGAPWIVERNNIVERTEAGCPSFPSVLYSSLVYNVGCIPWDLEFNSSTMSGNTNGAYFQWYRYKESEGASTAQPCSWQTDHSTFEGFKPATDENNSRYIYYCLVTTPNCPSGTKSGKFTVVVGQDGDPCPTFAGTTFTITSGGSYTSGQTVTITATTTAYGGDHIYTWYHNGVALDTTDTRYTFVWGFNQPQLIIANIRPEDGGMYSIQMQDGTECYMYTDPVRILVDSPSCGPVPTLGVQKKAICEGESTQTGVSNNTLAAGEVGQIVYMVKPDGSNPSTTIGTWTTDMPGLYQFKYVVENPNNPSCYRESKVATIRVYENGGTVTITPSVAVEKTTNKVTFTCSPAPGTDETATVTFSSNGGQTGSVYPNTYPNFAHTCYNSGTYTYTYTITNTKAGCSRTATCEVMWYSCGWVTARFNNWVADKIKVGGSINLGPAVPTETGMIGILTVSKDGGTPEVIPTSSPYTPTDPGTYVFHYEVKHSDPRVTDCYSEVSKTIVVEPCGTKAQLSTNKTVLKLGESASLTFNRPASGETAKMEVSKDGGAKSTISNIQSPMTYTPTAVGEYVITYTITPSGCQATSQSVTIKVYDCGPDATISADRTSIQPGGTVNLTVSTPGANETATLTVSKDGGAAQPISNIQSPMTYTPNEVGEYVLTYTISHAYIECSRSAQVTIRAYNCGTPAGLTTDKNVLKLGESASLTLNRQPVAADGETASLTVSKDGGAAQPISNIQSPMTYTPTAVGEYVITYTITPSGCQATSQSVTINVYDCGPDATISADRTSIQPGGTVNLTVSTPGADETATLTVSKDGGAQSPISNLQSPMTYTPTAVGEYVLTYTVSHPYIDCTRSASVTIKVYDCGVPAAITSDKATLKLGESASLTLSALGADETATLTCSVNGGTPYPVTGNPSPLTFTPDAVGEYVLTYTITHPYIDCTRSASVTIKVYDCGVPAAITSDKAALKLGESASLTLSAFGADETATLTVSKDGSTPSPVTHNPSSVTFTPDAVGEYVLTYTVSHTKITCETSASVTIKVYDCGPDATISADRTSIQPGGTVNLTVSTPGADETATLTVSKDGGPAQPISNIQSPMTYTPNEVGEYVLTYTISHAYIDCSRSAQVTIRAYSCGTPAGLTTDKNVLKPGESASLTLNRQPVAADGETASLTVSKDGGTPSPVTHNPSSVTFTPDAVGEYVLTYSIDNVALGCATSAQVTIRVYDCGPEATITTDKDVLKLGESASLTLSALGADETATLTVSKDGGAAQPISNIQSPMTYTPTAVGEYVLTYTITHPYIDCTRSASVTIKVYDCGVPAAITSDKAALKLGESASLTLSAVLPVETATLTVSKDGGTPSPVTHNPSSVTFTPDAVGEYVLTYTVSHTKITCETSASVTIKVYDCGPDIEMTLPVSEIKIMRTTTITLSAPGADETATLTVSINGDAQSPISNLQSPMTYTPTELGVHTFTYTITHPFINCTRTVTATLNVIEAELVFDDKNGTHVWSDPQNWWPAYSRIPNAADSAIIRKNCNVDIDNAVTYDLTFDGGSINIQPQDALIVMHQVLPISNVQSPISNNFTIASDASGNGALILGPDNTDLSATVLFYARSTDMNELYPVWQYMGSPVQEALNIDAAYPGAVFYEWTNTPNHKTGGNWQRVDSLTGELSPFKGYCMTQLKDKQYTLQGTLNNPVLREVAIPFNDQGFYSGFAFVANSWVAPISIAAMSTEDFGGADATVYIMNSGTYEEAIQQQRNASYDGTAAARGQYNAIPVHAASYLPNALTVIPPMQGFFVHTSRATTLSLDYNRTVYTPALTRVITTPTRAPQTHNPSPVTHNPSVLRFRVEGFGSEDEVYLLTSETFTTRFDNGWEAIKARSENSDISMAVTSADGDLAVAAIPELEGTEITFDGGNHKTYTITVTGNPSPVTEDLYLLDTESGIYTELRDGMTYSFKCGAATRRFVITNDQYPISNLQYPIPAFKYIENGLLYIRAGKLYNAQGQLVK